MGSKYNDNRISPYKLCRSFALMLDELKRFGMKSGPILESLQRSSKHFKLILRLHWSTNSMSARMSGHHRTEVPSSIKVESILVLTICVNVPHGRVPRPRGVSSIPEFGFGTSSQRLISILLFERKYLHFSSWMTLKPSPVSSTRIAQSQAQPPT